MRIRCTACSAQLQVADEVAGKRIRCPRCKEPTVAAPAEPVEKKRPASSAAIRSESPKAKPRAVPQKAAAAVKSRSSDEDDDTPRPKKKKKKPKKDNSQMIVGIAVAGGVTVCIAITAVILVVTKPAPPAAAPPPPVAQEKPPDRKSDFEAARKEALAQSALEKKNAEMTKAASDPAGTIVEQSYDQPNKPQKDRGGRSPVKKTE